jgi:uncharacterized protein DUF4177
MNKYEYKFVRVDLKAGWSTDTPKEDYQNIVHDHADEGWRLHQIFAPATSGTGWASYFELIFERVQASGGNGDSQGSRAEPAVAADETGITVLRGMKSL